MASFDAYEILEVGRDADAATIRRAYQKLARRHHPDFAPEDEAAGRRFRDLERAYRILGDPELRRRYDEGLLRLEREERPEPGPRRRVVSASYFEVWTARRSSGPAHEREPAGEGAEGRGALDLSAEVKLDFAEALRGTVASLSVQRERWCEECRSTGATSDGAAACDRCSGRGVLVDLERVRVRLPVAIEDGARLRLRGRGHPAPPSGPGAPGDLFLTVRVRPHPYFRRQGLDVFAELPVTFAEAALGAEVEVPTVDGPVKVRIPAGTQGGQRFRLRGKGARSSDGEAGDHYYRVRITVPPRLDEATRELVESLPVEDPRGELPRERV